MNNSQRSPFQNFILILIIGALNTISPFTIDMYLPAFPKIAAELRTDIQTVALSVSAYFFGFALGQILYGPLLDRFGRKPPLYAGLVFYVGATLACALSTSINSLLVFRFLQALGGCVSSVAAMAMVIDFFPANKSSRILSTLILILGASPLLAPTIGGLIVTVWSWRYVFVLLALFAGLMVACVFFFLPQGQQPDRSISLMPRPIVNGFKQVLFEPQFYVFTLAGSLSFSGLFVYVAGSPAIFMEEFGVSSKTYGFIFAGLSVGFIGCSQLNHVLAKRFSSKQILRTVLIFQACVAVLFLLATGTAHCGFVPTLCFLFLILACCGLTYPNAAAIALSPFKRNAGTASSLLGFIQIGLGGLISACVSMLHLKGSLATALIMAASASLAVLLLLLNRKLMAREILTDGVATVIAH
jgi:MFS transporter, DHA1 family, multidrug resistance protein